MTDVKWIKFKVGTFDGKSFKKIKRAKIGGESYRDKLTAIWFELMDFAGKCNHSGAFIDSHEIPFAALDDIAIMIDREPEELELCMRFFINEGMVEVTNDVYTLSNWSVYQSEDKLERIRENNRARQARFRDKKKLLLEAAADSNEQDDVSVTLRNAADKEKDKEEDKEKDKETIGETKVAPAAPEPLPLPSEKPKKNINYQQIMDLYNSVCTALPSITALSDDRKKAIRARLSTYSVEDLQRAFEKAQASEFLRGKNPRNWRATFDWLIKDANLAKVLDGNYDNKPAPGRKEPVPDWMDKPKASPLAMAAVQKMLAEENPELAERVESLKQRIHTR